MCASANGRCRGTPNRTPASWPRAFPKRCTGYRPGGIKQVGCVYTAQGFEFDYVGVIFGRDLRYDPAINDWMGDHKESKDGLLVTQGKKNFTEFVKNTYRVLLTRA